MRAATLVLAVTLLGCGPRLVALYPHPERPRRADELATIAGPIASIDEQPVSSWGVAFQVVPGCHVVRLLERVGESNLEGTGGYVAVLSPLAYLFQTRAGYEYGFDRDARGGSGHFGQFSIVAFERAPDGAVRTFGPARGKADIEACLDGGRAQPGPSPRPAAPGTNAWTP